MKLAVDFAKNIILCGGLLVVVCLVLAACAFFLLALDELSKAAFVNAGGYFLATIGTGAGAKTIGEALT